MGLTPADEPHYSYYNLPHNVEIYLVDIGWDWVQMRLVCSHDQCPPKYFTYHGTTDEEEAFERAEASAIQHETTKIRWLY